jgi:hypothetical protein
MGLAAEQARGVEPEDQCLVMGRQLQEPDLVEF